MTSVWDDPALAPSSGNFVKFDNVGDTVSGEVLSITKKTWDDGNVCPSIDFLTDDGEEKTLTAGQMRLKAALHEKRPAVGDHLTITLTDVEKRSGKTYKSFDVQLLRKSAEESGAADGNGAQYIGGGQVSTDARNAALAKLTPEERAAMGGF